MTEVLQFPAPAKFPDDFLAKDVQLHTLAFHRALARWWRQNYSVRPFDKLTPSQQSEILQAAEMFRREFTICDYSDAWSDCNRFGVVYLLGNPHGEVLCLEHFKVRQK